MIVDTDTVLSAPVARQRFQAIAGKCRQVSNLASGVELLQLPLGDARQLPQASAEPTRKQRLGLGILERADHGDLHYNAMRYTSTGMVRRLPLLFNTAARRTPPRRDDKASFAVGASHS